MRIAGVSVSMCEMWTIFLNKIGLRVAVVFANTRLSESTTPIVGALYEVDGKLSIKHSSRIYSLSKEKEYMLWDEFKKIHKRKAFTKFSKGVKERIVAEKL